MKPVNLNQLLFHPKSTCLSFYVGPKTGLTDEAELEVFLKDMESQLLLQHKVPVANLLEKLKPNIKKVIHCHPNQSHGFFIAEDLQGYINLDQKVEPYCIIGQTFHVRPLMEDLFVNPEYILVNISLYDIKIYRGDFQHLEIMQQYEFDQLPKGFFGNNSARLYAPQYMGLIPFKTILALKTIAQKLMDMILYHSLPVIVTGLEELKTIFLRYFEHSFGVISHIHEDFYEKTCVEIVERCKLFRHTVMDYYSAQFKERLKKMVKSKRIISDLEGIIKATYSGKVVHLVLPTEKKLWGRLDPDTGEYSIHKRVNKKNSMDILNELAEEVMRQGGKIQILGPHFFPQDAHVLAILRG
ncbi:hypothetical protein [Peredibacter starrii]|uniref:Uncharacterized protein n=1 Tax=Peredibacter starrii TaxID=28202 RepID=A0AAX4HVI7_9BACT|nr:hypothetical protein [Peredibacter starrii]WPU67182.1 hypothetical protein SOO65_10490 [Peredibacter starrii]